MTVNVCHKRRCKLK